MVAMMAEPVLAAIRRQKAACMLLALRSILRGKGKWCETEHGAAFQEKYEQLCERWK